MIRRPPRSTLFPTRRSSDLISETFDDGFPLRLMAKDVRTADDMAHALGIATPLADLCARSEEHTSELQSRLHLVCRLLLEKKKNKTTQAISTYCRIELQREL